MEGKDWWVARMGEKEGGARAKLYYTIMCQLVMVSDVMQCAMRYTFTYITYIY